MSVEKVAEPRYHHTCDRCRVTVETRTQYTPVGWGRLHAFVSEQQPDDRVAEDRDTKQDMCPTCLIRVRDWLANPTEYRPLLERMRAAGR